MSGSTIRAALVAVIASTMALTIAFGAQAHDRSERERWEHHHRHFHHREHGFQLIDARPVEMLVPAIPHQPVDYSQGPMGSSVNLNLNIPLQ